MTQSQHGETFSCHSTRAAVQRANGKDLFRHFENPMTGPGDDTHARLRNLQEWICELLVQNQQLRMALMEMKAGRAADVDEN